MVQVKKIGIYVIKVKVRFPNLDLGENDGLTNLFFTTSLETKRKIISGWIYLCSISQPLPCRETLEHGKSCTAHGIN